MLRKRLGLASVVGALFLTMSAVAGGATAQTNENAEANRLMVEAMGLIDRAETQVNPVLRLDLLQDAQARLDRILKELPGTDLAVRLALRAGLGRLDPDALAREIADLLPIACATAPGGECILQMAGARTEAIADAAQRAEAHRQIALAWSLLGDQERAQAAIDHAHNAVLVSPDADTRRVGRELIEVSRATILARAGRIDEAVRLATAVDEPGSQAQILAAAAISQAELGDIVGARSSIAIVLQIVPDIPQPGLRDSALHAIARAQATVGDIPAALATTGEITNAYAAALTGCWVAYAGMSSVDADALERMLAAATDLASAADDARDRARLLACVAAAYAQSGDNDRASDLVRQGLDGTATTPSAFQHALIQAFMVRPLRLAGAHDEAVTLAAASMEVARNNGTAFDAVRLLAALASAYRA